MKPVPSLAVDTDRAQLRAIVRRSLARYRGGSFTLGDSGGARGMLFFTDVEGGEFFCGGLNVENAQPICDALNAILRLVER
jgi:hypothetical protein